LCVRVLLLLASHLFFNEFGVNTILVPEKFVMSALLNDVALLNHDDFVRSPNGGESVRHNDQGLEAELN